MFFSRKYLEILLGFLIILVVAIIFFNFLRINHFFRDADTYSVFAQFRNVSGLNPGSSVLISGVIVGKIDSLILNQDDAYKVTVKMKIMKDFQIPSNSVAIITSNTILSENKYIKIEPYQYSTDNQGSFLKDGDTISNTQSPSNIMDMIVQKFFSG